MANVLPILGKGTTTYADSGAIDPRASIAKLTKATAAAMTLAAPEVDYDGHELFIWSTTAAAHTVTYTPGFGGVGAGGDVATFGGAIGDSVTLVASAGTWVLKAAYNVTAG